MCLESSPGISLPFSRAELHLPALSVHTQPVWSNPIRCSHLLLYRADLFSFEKQHDLLHSAAALSPFFIFSYVPMERGYGFVLHMLSELVARKDSLLSKGKAVNQRGRRWRIVPARREEYGILKWHQSSNPTGTWIELLCFFWKFQLIPGIYFFSIKEWRQVWVSPCNRDNSVAEAVKPYWPALHRATKYTPDRPSRKIHGVNNNNVPLVCSLKILLFVWLREIL